MIAGAIQPLTAFKFLSIETPSTTSQTEDVSNSSRETENGPVLQYPKPPEREYQLAELLGFAGYEGLAETIRESRSLLFC